MFSFWSLGQELKSQCLGLRYCVLIVRWRRGTFGYSPPWNMVPWRYPRNSLQRSRSYKLVAAFCVLLAVQVVAQVASFETIQVRLHLPRKSSSREKKTINKGPEFGTTPTSLMHAGGGFLLCKTHALASQQNIGVLFFLRSLGMNPVK